MGIEAGNVCRHTATLLDVGASKAGIVARRLNELSPMVQIDVFETALAGSEQRIIELLEPYDLIVDCTGSDDALDVLATAWWPIPRTFASFSMGFGGRRVFCFGVTAHEFPRERFRLDVTPWLQEERTAWADSGELLEGPGCWSPLFPARCDDVAMAAVACLNELDTLASQKPRDPRFRVFEKQHSTDGFGGFSLRHELPFAEAS
jgi:molybdopterin/thiamine biosynthesis adenylyltransferase